ncbi:hypothetical protein V6R85_02385 [Agrobacterium sp. CCNWLW32]|uniref:hypothetical protein n=1 Tax=Agrobacterium sp. CCNWLW32 TaxID=3122072 RepID=UPI000458DA69|nr:hypothetical protein AWN88_25500 [Agrobacterium tumefaciens]KAJ36284.1 hypothetical protein BW45_22875 [Agrobacterium tumefaciens]
MNRDRLNHLPPKPVAIAALNFLDSVSDHNKETQAVALAVTLLAYAKRNMIDVGDVFTVANNLLHAHQDEKDPNMVALQLYVRHEL